MAAAAPMVFPPGGAMTDPATGIMYDPATAAPMVDPASGAPLDATMVGPPQADGAPMKGQPSADKGLGKGKDFAEGQFFDDQGKGKGQFFDDQGKGKGMMPFFDGKGGKGKGQPPMLETGPGGFPVALKDHKVHHEEPEGAKSLRQTILFIGYLTLVLNIAALIVPMWRVNSSGVMNYDMERSWGIFVVKGRTITPHHVIAARTCESYGTMNADGICGTPICAWYKTKCENYIDIMMLSYCAGGAIIGGIVFHIMCIMWTSSGSTVAAVRWASMCWPIALILQIGGAASWIVLSWPIFEKLDKNFVFPKPEVGVSFFLAVGVAIGQMLNCTLGASLKAKFADWEVEDDDGDDDDEGEYDYEDGNWAEEGAQFDMPMPPPPEGRVNIQEAIFSLLVGAHADDGSPQKAELTLDSRHLREYASLCGFEGSPEEWEAEYQTIAVGLNCDAVAGLNLAAFQHFLDEEHSSGFSDDGSLTQVWTQLYAQKDVMASGADGMPYQPAPGQEGVPVAMAVPYTGPP